jgi:hypothetical protein
MKEQLEAVIALVWLMVWLSLAWVMKIKDPFGEEQEYQMLLDEVGTKP